MRKVQFDVPADVLAEFVDAASSKELNSRITGRDEDSYEIEIEYTKDEAELIDELEDELERLVSEMQDEDEEEEDES